MSGTMTGLYNADTGLVGNRNDPRYLMAMKLMTPKMPDAIPGRGATIAAALGGMAQSMMAAKLMGDAHADGQAAGEEQKAQGDAYSKRVAMAARLMSGDDPGGAMPGPAPQAAPMNAGSAPPPAAPTGGTPQPPAEFLPLYQQAAADSGVPLDVLLATHARESRFNPSARGASGENGIAQILPSTGAQPGYGLAPISPQDAMDPAKAIPWSASYMAGRAKAIGADLNDPAQRARGIAAYNGSGPQAAAYGQQVAGMAGGYQPSPKALAARLQQGDGPAPAPSTMSAPSGPPSAGRIDFRQVSELNALAAEGLGDPNPLVRQQAQGVAARARLLEQQYFQQQQAGDRFQNQQFMQRERLDESAQRSRERAEDRNFNADQNRLNRAVTTRDVLDDDGKVRTYAVNPDGSRGRAVGLAAKQPDAPGAAPPFAGNGMEQQSANALIQLGPKVQDGTATSDEHARYAMAYNHMQQGTVQPVPDPRDPTGKTMVLARIPGNIPQGFPPPRVPGPAAAQGTGQDTAAPGVGGPGAAGAGVIGGGAPGAPPPASPVDPRAPQIIPGTARPDKDANEAERVAAGFASRMATADEIMARVGAPGGADMAAGKLGGVGNFFMSSAGQQYQQAAQAWVRAKLRKESGAAIGVDEMRQELATYFPQPGDGADVIAQKQAMREGETRAMRMAAGRAYGMADPATTPGRSGQGGGQQSAGSTPTRITSDAEFNALPSGTAFIGPDGKPRRKP